ncbi:MAG: hypothetical protein GY875_14765 [Gammaproteobacteria bacterium]|nr:hypothetical protein [Gammaproteobacteria bacterium]
MLNYRSFNRFIIVSLTLLGFSIASANAATVSFDPSAQSVGLGGSVDVDLRISGLGADILTSFDLDLSFDATILGYTGFDFGTGLDSFGLGLNEQIDTDFGGGLVNVFELSIDSDDVLLLSQDDDFVLGTFHFMAIGLGTSGLSVTAHPFAEALGGHHGADGSSIALAFDPEAGSVSVVPVPAAVWLFGTALIGLVGFGKRKASLAVQEPHIQG